MASPYPTSKDNLSATDATSSQAMTRHAELFHNAERSAIDAIENALGTTGSPGPLLAAYVTLSPAGGAQQSISGRLALATPLVQGGSQASLEVSDGTFTSESYGGALLGGARVASLLDLNPPAPPASSLGTGGVTDGTILRLRGASTRSKGNSPGDDEFEDEDIEAIA